MMNRKRKLSGLLPGCLLPVCLLTMTVAGCTDNVVPATDTELSIQLHARGGALEGAATRTEQGDAFTASVAFSSTAGAYSSLDKAYEGVWTADVSTSGDLAWKTGGGITTPEYSPYGDDLYLVAYAPAQTPSSGTVTYDLTTQPDLLYANELQGNRWDGNRFAGNTQSDKDQPLVFNHLLTRLSFKVCKKQAGGLAVRVIRITVNGADTQAVFPLSTGQAAFSTPDGNKGLSLTVAGGGADISSTVPVEVGKLMLPPVDTPSAYTLTVETSVGTYNNVNISYEDTQGDKLLKAGISHEITLAITDRELEVSSITVAPWTLIDAGSLDIGERD